MERQYLKKEWSLWARDNQLPPPNEDWVYWLIQAGRGFGKTRTGAEWVRDQVETKGVMRVALIAPTAADVRDVMVNGEAFALDTPIHTPSGLKTMETLRVGDEVYAGDGTITQVVAKSSVWRGRPCYRVKIRGARPLVADAAHQWVTSSRAERRNDRSEVHWAIRSTEELFAQQRKRRSDLAEFCIPDTAPVAGETVRLAVAPYTLGAWLGDGDTRGHGQFTSADPLIIERIRHDGFTVKKHKATYAYGIGGLRAALEKAGVTPGTKHIPPLYLTASVQQRAELFQGLMDTDGTVDKAGWCSFSNTNDVLIEQVRQLAASLGFLVTRIRSRPAATKVIQGQSYDCRASWEIGFMWREGLPIPFHLSRKVARLKRQSTRRRWRLIDRISLCETQDTQCIQVAHPSGTFLIGLDYVVTHNSGIIGCSRNDFLPKYEPSKRRIIWPNGATGMMYSAEESERLRGPQHEKAWCDELAAWADEGTWDMLQFGMRLGANPQSIITTTPKPTIFMNRIRKLPGLVTTRGSMLDNRKNLPDSFLRAILDRYQGTRLGKQEIEGLFLSSVEGAIFSEQHIMKKDGPMDTNQYDRICVAIDPAVSSGEGSDETGIIVAGSYNNGKNADILEDKSGHYKPNEWAELIIHLYHEWKADKVLGEVNNGGDLVEHTLRQSKRGLSVAFQKLHSSKGKRLRAEPVGALYEQHRVFHTRYFEQLEEQMVTFNPEELAKKGQSPDRVDAMVFALTWLIVERKEPRVRFLHV